MDIESLWKLDSLCKQVLDERITTHMDNRARSKRERLTRPREVQTQQELIFQVRTSSGRRKNLDLGPPTLDDEHVIQLRHYLEPIRHQFQWTYSIYHYIDLGLLHLLYAERLYLEVHIAINLMVPPPPATYHLPVGLEEGVDSLWHNASYQLSGESRLTIGRHLQTKLPNKPVHMLTPVDRYRIRKRCPCPIVLRQGEKKYKLSQRSKDLLHRAFSLDPKPKKPEKQRLSSETGLSLETVSNWFKNRRQRCKYSEAKLFKPVEPKVESLPDVPSQVSTLMDQISPAASSGYQSQVASPVFDFPAMSQDLMSGPCCLPSDLYPFYDCDLTAEVDNNLTLVQANYYYQTRTPSEVDSRPGYTHYHL